MNDVTATVALTDDDIALLELFEWQATRPAYVLRLARVILWFGFIKLVCFQAMLLAAWAYLYRLGVAPPGTATQIAVFSAVGLPLLAFYFVTILRGDNDTLSLRTARLRRWLNRTPYRGPRRYAVAVTADGLDVSGDLDRQIPWAEVRRIDRTDAHLFVALADGDWLVVPAAAFADPAAFRAFAAGAAERAAAARPDSGE
ncbi:MAG: YcxB family protein [Gemmataceae bacterium]